ncbi:Adenylosuccinate lyase @ SAICAR lyase [hydrothermal vent metagenome]|uniref:Adenylosuccinate lyase @ SAICAR lyase n=1 Tax=hydrothermal vent metagenome TaxID=652676 RepID=A0A3B1E710_9ZZZZ
MTSSYDTYTSPLAARNASPEMLRLWSPRHKFNTWRKIWLAVAEAQHELGLPVSEEQVEELRAVVNRPGGITDEEMHAAEQYERDLRHDVMAHVHALGDSCPNARPIIHLGMTSQDVVCNADVICLRESIDLILAKCTATVCAFGDLGRQHALVPTLAFTHYQAAQPTTVGRRCAQWACDLEIPNSILGERVSLINPRGLKGATGTQASFLKLLGSSEAVDKLEAEFLARLSPWGFWNPSPLADLDDCHHGLVNYIAGGRHLTGQTYPRVNDTFILSTLASIASVLHKIATDIRLLSNRKELDEPFESKQIGSSAMPYKRNPMRCERICGLTRFVMNLVGNAYDTAATQWLERTLDDSSNRRLSLPEAFLALDGSLDLMHNVASGLVVHEATIRKNLMAELPFMATENILMACVKLGADRQDYHERLRLHAQEAGMRVKQQGLDNDLLDRLRADPAFQSKAQGGLLDGELDWDDMMDPMHYIGRSVEQTERFIKEVVEPLREQYADAIDKLGDSGPRV